MPDETRSVIDLLALLLLGTCPALVVGVTLQMTWLRNRQITGAANLMPILLLLFSTVLITLGLSLPLWLLTPAWLTALLPTFDSFLLEAAVRLILPSIIAATAAIIVTRTMLSGRCCKATV
jgi:hypothetical protein